METIYTSAEAAKELKIDRVTLWRLRRTGKIACRKVGRLIRFTEGDLTEFMERSKSEIKPRKVKNASVSK